ncbi:MAG: tRNA threonylcarbamoyladenosine dehydratase [Firmicutes bacterium]|nr:tRNA threonylcarbamoyladenosine dehydratase [Bacillota bacterium]
MRNMNEKFIRTEILFGKENMEKLKNLNVIIFGLGGVGGYVCEALARSGIYNLTLVDHDKISESNINRQIFASINNINKLKVEVARKKILNINPEAKIKIWNKFVDENNIFEILDKNYDYVVDAIDSVKSKISIILLANKLDLKIISCMGMGNKIEPSKIKLADIFETKYCPLAKIIRHELKKHGIKKLKVCYSDEEPIKINYDNKNKKEKVVGSVAYVPSVAGLLIASEIINNVIKK